MNYYEHHIGDYDAATAHLSMLEDAAYSRLMRLYYRKEAPIPADLAVVCRLVRASSKDERAAVQAVLSEFFELREDGWHQPRCDSDILSYQKRAERNRAVGKLGGRPRKTATQAEPTKNHDGFQTATQAEPTKNPHQTPDTRHQEIPNTRSSSSTAESARANPTVAGSICLAMRQAGVLDGNPGHPDLLALIAAGATEAEFVGAAQAAAGKGKGFAYAIGTLKRQRQEAAACAASMPRGPMQPPHRSAGFDRKSRQLEGAAILTGAARPAPVPTTLETIDVAPRVIAA